MDVNLKTPDELAKVLELPRFVSQDPINLFMRLVITEFEGMGLAYQGYADDESLNCHLVLTGRNTGQPATGEQKLMVGNLLTGSCVVKSHKLGDFQDRDAEEWI